MGDLDRQIGQNNPSATRSAISSGADAGSVIGTGAAVNAGADAGIAAGNAPGSYGISSLATGLMGPGAGFAFDQEALHRIAKAWEDLANEFSDDQAYATRIAHTTGPGKEYASSGNAEKVQASGQALLTSLQDREQYCRGMANKFIQALGKYATAEETHATVIKKTGDSL